MPSLPSIPETYLKLGDAFRRPDVSPTEIGKIVAQDLGIDANVLQLVNSPCFGLSRSIGNLIEATVYLGTETMR